MESMWGCFRCAGSLEQGVRVIIAENRVMVGQLRVQVEMLQVCRIIGAGS